MTNHTYKNMLSVEQQRPPYRGHLSPHQQYYHAPSVPRSDGHADTSTCDPPVAAAGPNSAASNETPEANTTSNAGSNNRARHQLARPINTPETPPTETHLFNPFENRTINLDDENNSKEQAGSSMAVRPNNLDIPGSSNIGVPGYLRKQAEVYESQLEDVSTDPHPEPPPNYEDVMSEQQQHQLPRTIVIQQPVSVTTVDPEIIAERRQMECPQCKQVVNTVVQRSNGVYTHLAAVTCCLIGCWPFTVCAYATDILKDSVHLCPVCNTQITKDTPFLGIKGGQ